MNGEYFKQRIHELVDSVDVKSKSLRRIYYFIVGILG
jgi:hypothetical protein